MPAPDPRRDELWQWSRPDEILLPDERDRLAEWLDLFDEQLRIVAADPARPTVLERFAARKRTRDLWAFDRVTSDGAVMRTRVRDAVTRQIARAELFAEGDLNGRLAHLLFESIEDADRLLRYGRQVVIADTPDDNVVPLKKRRGGAA